MTHIDDCLLVLDGAYKVAGGDDAQGLASLDICGLPTGIILFLLFYKHKSIKAITTGLRLMSLQTTKAIWVEVLKILRLKCYNVKTLQESTTSQQRNSVKRGQNGCSLVKTKVPLWWN